ncbi:MAG TPA: NAD-dependent epimerase/dehydratase family protein [Pyrinomonadaceae bacterium]
MKILVTGGSGYLGTHVCRFFSADDFSRRSNLNVLSLSDAERVQDYDVVIHLAAHLDKSPDGAELSFRTNAEGTRNLLLNMRPNSVFIYASTKDVYGSHAGEYAEVPEGCVTLYAGQSALEWSKLMGEQYVSFYARQRDVRACVFRLSAVYARPSSGNENGFVTHYVESVKHRWPIRLPADVDPVRDILYVDDFSRACQAFIDSPLTSGLYNLGGGRTNSMRLRELIQTIGNLIEIEPTIEDVPNIPAPVPLDYVSDLTRIREELNWEPQTSIEEGLRNLL